MPVLEITFTGLFLFVPESRRPRKLHILLPGTGGTTGVHPHVAKVRQLESTRPEITLANEDFILTGDGGPVLFPPHEAVDLEELTGGLRFPQSSLRKPDPRPRVYARILLPGATSITPGQTARWNIPGLGERTLTHQLTWRLEGLAGTSVTLSRDPFGPGGGTSEVFHAVDGMVRLCIEHLPTMVHIPCKGCPAHHFPAFYGADQVFGAGPNPVPTLAQEPGTMQPSPCDSGDVDEDADTFTCMVAQVRPG